MAVYKFNRRNFDSKHHDVEHHFGRNDAVGTSFEDIWTKGNFYSYPTAPFKVELISTSAADDINGNGARRVEVMGLDSNFDLATELIDMNGTSVTNPSETDWIRIHAICAHSCGEYSQSDAGSNHGTITVRTQGDNGDHAEIQNDGVIGYGYSQVARFTIPRNHSGYLESIHYHVDANKAATIVMWERTGANIVTPPYKSKIPLIILDGLEGSDDIKMFPPFKVPEMTDIWFMGKVDSGTGGIDIDFAIQLEKYK